MQCSWGRRRGRTENSKQEKRSNPIGMASIIDKNRLRIVFHDWVCSLKGLEPENWVIRFSVFPRNLSSGQILNLTAPGLTQFLTYLPFKLRGPTSEKQCIKLNFSVCLSSRINNLPRKVEVYISVISFLSMYEY